MIDAFLASSLHSSLSYTPVGIAREKPQGYNVAVLRIEIGAGSATFERARAAIENWEMFNTGFTEVFPRHASTEDGSTVAVLVRHTGFWSLNACRVVYQVRTQAEEIRFGFAYGTLTEHGERGEEIFAVCLHSATERVTYWLRAVSRPAALLTMLGYPLARLLQARFRKASGAAMARAVTHPHPQEGQ